MIRISFAKSTFTVLLLAIVFGFGQGSANAQATFQVSGTATAITKTGHTELVGTVTFTVASGTTQAGTIEFFIPNVQITNSASSGIQLTGTGGLVSATIASVVPDNGIVIVNIPAGAGPGASTTLSGVRISAVGKTFNTLDASVSSRGNSIFAGQNLVRIVRAVNDGLTVDSSSQTTVTVSNGVVVVAPAAFIVTEGWERAFSSAVGTAGQTVKTQVIFRALGLPDNVSLTFPSPVTSNTGATLVTTSGVAEALTNQSTAQRVVYEFNDSATNPSAVDSFSITPTIDFTGTPGTGTLVIQASLGPIGTAVPDATLPSTAIPRFGELFLPPLSTIPNPPPLTTSLSLSVPAVDDETITISNTGSGGAIATIRARREDGALATGTNVTNEVTRNFTARQTTTFSLKDLFGTGASVSGISAVEVESPSNALVVNSFGSAGGRRFANPRMPEGSVVYIPFDRRTSSDIPLLDLHDTSNSSSTVNITLNTSAGATVSSAQRTVNALGAVRENFSTLFPSVSLPLEGYVVIRASSAVRCLLVNNPASRPDEIPTLFNVSNSPTIFPFFAFGGGYSTVLQLINPSDSQGMRVILSAFSANGTSLSAQPYVQTLAANERRNFDFATIFAVGSGSGTTVGYFSLALEPLIILNPFASPPTVFGVVRVGTAAFSSVIAFSQAVGGGQFFLTPAAETSSTYTGLAITNPSSGSVSVTVDAFSANGTSLGTTTFSLDANTARIQLLRELLPQSANNDNVLVRITSTPASIRIVSFRGTLDGNELINLNGETTP